MTVPIPAGLYPVAAMFHPENQSRGGGVSLTGSEQVVTSPAGRWRATLSFALAGPVRVQSYRAMIARLQGRAGEILVGPYDPHRPTDAAGRRLSLVEASSVDGCERLFDQSGFGQLDAEVAIAATHASARAVQISISMLDGAEGPRPGQYFGIDDRLYLVTAVWQEGVGSVTNLRFWPPLREALSPSTNIILDRPVCKMRLASDAAGELSLEILQGTSATTSLDFVEIV